MARGYKTYRKYRRYQKSKVVRRLLKRYKPLAGFGINGERFKIDSAFSISPMDYQNNVHYTFMNNDGAFPQTPKRYMTPVTLLDNHQKLATLRAVFDQARIYGCSISLLGAGQMPVNAAGVGNTEDTVLAVGFTMAVMGRTNNPGWGDVIALEKKFLVSKTKPNGRMYFGRKNLGKVDGYGYGDYVPWAWTSDIGDDQHPMRTNFQLWIANSGSPTALSPHYTAVITFYIEVKLTHI